MLKAAESLADTKPSDSQARKKSATLLAELNKVAGGHVPDSFYWLSQLHST